MTKSTSVAVIDYGMGNLHSVSKALQKVAPDAEVWVGDDKKKILAADRVVYPGVGAIRDCIGEIQRRGLDDVITEVARNKPLLGICVGMQGLMRHSEENGGIDCLGVFPHNVVRFAENTIDEKGDTFKVPHMGWSEVRQVAHSNGDVHPLWQSIADGSRFYFVHSYYVPAGATAEDCPEAAGLCNYQSDVIAAIARDNIFAVQFHPEKSHRDGLQLLQNFMNWSGETP